MKKILMLLGAIASIHAYAEVPVVDMSAIAQLVQQVSSLQQQIIYMQQNLAQLGTFNWADIDSSASQIAQIMDSATSLSYASSNIAAQFQSLFPGYKADSNYVQSYATIAANSLNTFKGTLQSLNMSYNTFINDAARLKAMQSQAVSADGAMKALSVTAQLVGEVANQVSQLRSVMLTQANSENAYMAQKAQLEATQKANSDAFFNNSSTVTPVYGTYEVDDTFYP